MTTDKQKYQGPRVNTTVDVIPQLTLTTDQYSKYILLGQKKEDKGCLRFIGGFVDIKDDTYIDAAFRELNEETGGCLSTLPVIKTVRLGEVKVPDPRLTGSPDTIITNVFVVDYGFRSILPELHQENLDDLLSIRWVRLENLSFIHLVKHHDPIRNMYLFGDQHG